VRSFYRVHYVPGNAIVVVVGDVAFEHVKKVVGKTFGRLRARPVQARFNPVEPEPVGPKRIEVVLPAQLPLVAVELPVPVWQPGENDTEVAALAVATSILSSGRSALLQQELVDRQRLVFSVGAGYDPFGMGLDLWYVFAALGPGKTPEAFEAALWKLIASLADKPQPADKLETVKRQLVAADIFARDSLYLRAKQIGRMEVTGIGAGNRKRWLEIVRKVQPRDVQQAVARWLKPGRASTGILLPEQSR
jgi:zinc protease